MWRSSRRHWVWAVVAAGLATAFLAGLQREAVAGGVAVLAWRAAVLVAEEVLL
jgi:hypothetical protein